MKNLRASLFAAALCLSLLAGCSSKKTIVGKWQVEKGHGKDNMQIEFTQDGKVSVTAGKDTANGTYSLPDSGHLTTEIELGGRKETETVAYTVSGDTLNTDKKGDKMTFTRVK